MNKKFYLLLTCCVFTVHIAFSQHDKKVTIAKQYMQSKLADWQLTEIDIADMSVDKVFQSEHNGVTHVYLRQGYQGIKIFNAINTINILPNGEVLYASNRFLSNIKDAINSTQATISTEDAIFSAIEHLKIKDSPNLSDKKIIDQKSVVYKKTNISDSDIKVELLYHPISKKQIQLVWQLAIEMPNTPDHWNIRVDALSGKVLDKNNWTTYCKLGMHKHNTNCGFLEKQNKHTNTSINSFFENSGTDGASYNVFAIPAESPAHANRSIINEPSTQSASPFGWHDTDGIAGPEFTITRGNNVHAYADPNDLNRSSNDEPDGGANLQFDFSFDPNAEPLANKDAAVTQLFYANNVIHDITYQYGFNEQAGNFQAKNYTNLGRGGDYVEAEALDGASQGSEGNASFSTPGDGQNGSMAMFVWNRGGNQVLQIVAPTALAGSVEANRAGFGFEINDSIAVSGSAVIAVDGSNQPTLGCNEIVNKEDVNGKVAFIDRGDCFFVEKARNAQNAGAIAVVICNFENALLGGGLGTPPGDPGNDINIPVVLVRSGDCQVLRQAIGEGLQLNFQIPPSENEGPDQLDGDFDNGIVFHEFAHGISNRLTGGSSTASCLVNNEQMGEGWSDFFTLIMTAEPGDQGTDRRGIGTYVLRQDENAQGIRRFPYSTDMNIYPLTYQNTIGAALPHGLGEIWAAMLWDLYWAMSDEHGWDPDIYNGTGGNNMAIQLVMDGMKIQACSPGFIDGRDAILAADRANNGGANQCLIWEVFARRGLGFSASQGSANDNNDPIEGFDVLPECVKTLKIAKSTTPIINAGDEIEVNITVTNHKEAAATNVIVTDEVPDGATPIISSLATGASMQGNMLQFEIGELAQGATQTITYRLSTATNKASIRQFLDDGENGDQFWLPINLEDESTNIWDLQDAISKSGEFAWHVSNPTTSSDQTLQLDEEITVSGTQPILRFNHWHDIDPGTDGGIVEISTDFGTSWQDLEEHFIRNTYTGNVAYVTFASPNQKGFWGDSQDFKTSYIDLSAFMGETIFIRYRFGSNDDSSNSTGSYNGWFVDDVEFMDLVAYQGQACISSGQGDNVCAMAAEGGTFVEVGLNTSVKDLETLGLQFDVFPNPAGDYINISLSNEKTKEGTLSLLNMNGQTLHFESVQLQKNAKVIPLNVQAIPSGFYFIKIQTDEGIAMKKVMLQ